MANKSDLKILFVNCCLRRNAPTKILPMGLASVMTFVREHGYRFDLLDIDINEYEDAYIEDYLKSHTYDVILLGSIVTHYKWVKWFCHKVKEIQPSCRLVVGNSVAGSVFETFLTKVPADVVVVGEGEYTTLDVLDAFVEGRDLSTIQGVALRDAEGKPFKTERRKVTDINALPMVSWDFFDVDRYIKKSATYMSRGVEGQQESATIPMPVSTARGCAFRCTFCHFVFWDDPYRYRNPESVLKEIKRNMDLYGANYINFWDDLSFASIPQVEKMCDAILASGLKFSWMAAIRCDLFGKEARIPYEKRLEVAQKMKQAGCMSVGFSLESGDPEILKMMNKKIEPEFFIEQVEILRQVGIVCNTSVVFGYPIETPETIKKTFDLCLRVGIYPSIGFLLPLPYTGMFNYAVEHGFIKDIDAYLDSITERQDICMNMTTMSTEQVMEEIKKGARRLNEALELGLADDKLIKTGGAKKQTNLKKFMAKKPPLDPEKVKRNENDFSFNYSEAVFDVDGGTPNGSC